MNFKEIQLTGFKSFADKTSVKFDDGVTCIVGPNGCGKSNVADAVRWVLGEQSARALRGSNMQDVIFGGTQTRRSLSYCEVTLVFDNSTRMFDIDYNEVAITRRLYRSGDSEYLLNLQKCRLKEIITLLHGVGIGKEGYSIIGQGKVEQIMNAKPEDRRAIFEEATGVMQFKTQKAEIERKLESTNSNLQILVQRLDEREKAVRPLEKQAETARKYRELSEKLRYEEVNSYLFRCESFESETKKYETAIADMERELLEVEAGISSADESERQGREDGVAFDAQVTNLNEKLRLFMVDIEHKSGEAKLIGERIQSHKRLLATAMDDVQYSLSRIKEIDAALAGSDKKRESSRSRAEMIGRECAELTRQVNEVNARVTAIERLSAEKSRSVLESVEGLADLRANVGSLSAKRDAAHERIEEVRVAIGKAKSRKEEYERQMKECAEQKAALSAFLDEKPEREKEIEEEISALGVSRQQLSKEIFDCNTSIANLTNNLEMYQGLKNRFDGYRDSVRRLQIAAKDDPWVAGRIKGTIADIVSTDKRYEVAIETAFGAAMQNIVTATEDDARDLIHYLKRQNAGIVTFLPVTALRARGCSREIRQAINERGAIGLAEELVKYDSYYQNIIGNLLGNTLICEDITVGTEIAKKYPRAFKIVTLDGDTIATSGAMTGGSHRKESGNLLAVARRIKECEDGIARREAAAAKLQKSLESCELEIEEMTQKREQLRLRVQEAAANYAAFAERETTLEGLVSTASHDVEEYTALLAQLESRVNNLESEVMNSAETEDALNKIRSEAAAEASEQQAVIEKVKAERDELVQRLNALQVEQATIESNRAADEAYIARITEERAALSKRAEEARSTIANTELLIERLKHDEEEAALTDDEKRSVSIIREKLNEAEESKRRVNERLQELAEKKRHLLARQLVLSDKKHAFELEISKAKAFLEHMEQRIEEAYGLTYEAALEYRDEQYDDDQSSTRISTLKRGITSLGPINQNAEEDYRIGMEECDLMRSQRDDVQKAIDDLTGALTQLREKMQQQFDAGFNEINSNFTTIFKELFGGGRAEMQLDYTDCDDPLNAGVEIIACPPGKKLTKISLLSGGERAYTAIAILFAILKTRPMPFCILDEIEAALDEANVDRFAKYLKKFSKDTQFIVITHRKPTMNQADTLFGVTMEEKGVSKIVSVKLSEVESRLGGDTVIA